MADRKRKRKVVESDEDDYAEIQHPGRAEKVVPPKQAATRQAIGGCKPTNGAEHLRIMAR